MNRDLRVPKRRPILVQAKMNATLDSVPLTESSEKEVEVSAWVDEEVNGIWRKSPSGQERDESP